MRSFTRKIFSVVKVFDTISLTLTLFLLAIVAINIIARPLYGISNGSINLMIPGGIELSKYTLLLIVFSTLPRASISGMVRVDILSNRLPTSMAQLLDKLWLILMGCFFIALFWLFSNKAILSFNRGDASQDLQIPLFYIYTLISIASFMTIISCFSKVFFKEEQSI